eukprot:1290081-Pleurochrysis_carterae.AAC.5
MHHLSIFHARSTALHFCAADSCQQRHHVLRGSSAVGGRRRRRPGCRGAAGGQGRYLCQA